MFILFQVMQMFLVIVFLLMVLVSTLDSRTC